MDGPGDGQGSDARLERRAALRLFGMGAAGVVAAGMAGDLLAACGSSSSGSAVTASTTRPALSPSVATGGGMPGAITGAPAASVKRFDPAERFWNQGAFKAVTREVEATNLPVDGAIPPELTGLLVRNGSNPRTGNSPHWFLGDGMLHGVRIERGKAVWYRNRWVRTPLEIAKQGFSGIPGKTNNQSNVAVAYHAGKLLTTGEVGWPFQIDPTDLSTIGAYTFDGRLGETMTAHPKIDPVTGRMHFFGYYFADPLLTYYVADRDGKLVTREPIAVRKSTMIHDFAVTDRDAIFWEGPVLFGVPGPIPQMPYGWDPSYGFRIGIMPIEGPASAIRWIEFDPQFIFHGVNAHREGDDVVITANRLASAFVKGTDPVTNSPSLTHRWRINTAGPKLTAKVEQITDINMDLPTVDRRHLGRPLRHAWFATTETTKEWGFEFAGICHMDITTGHTTRWEPGEDERAGEAFFVPSGKSEGDGWLLTYTYDRTIDRSHLVVLDAQDVAKGPVARVHLPVRVPFGFHGLWVADA
jgi:carotenoid cleavage dioxygenase